MRRFPLAVVLCASLGLAQVPVALPPPPPPFAPSSAPPPASATNEKPARVEGTIFSLNGDAVRKAIVRLQGSAGQPGQPPTSYVETADSAGKFVFDNIAPGRYTLTAEKPGFINARYGARSNSSPGTQLVLTEGMEMKDLSLKMTPQGVIVGKVVDEDGDPVMNAQIQLMRSVYAAGRRQLQPTGFATTNDLGEYRISSLAPGRYYVMASDRRQIAGPQDRPGRAGETPDGNLATYYPNGVDPSNAVPVEVAAGGELRGIDIRLLKGKVYTVRGKAVSTGALPLPAMVSFRRKDDNGGLPAALGGMTNQLRPDGGFEFRGVLPGNYVVQFNPLNINGSAPPNLTGRVEVTVNNADVEGVVLPLGPGPEIEGSVRLEDGDITTLLKPGQNATQGITVYPAAGRWQILLNSADVGTSSTQVNGDGTFRFNNVGTGKYSLNLLPIPPTAYLKSVRFAGQEVTHGFIDTTSGNGGTLELVLSSKPADVSGSVQNDKGEPLAGITVTLWPKIPDASPTGGARPAATDQNGGFQFKGLAPGDYYIAAWEELESGLTGNPDFVSRFTGDATLVTLSEGGHETRDLKPVAADKVAAETAKLP